MEEGLTHLMEKAAAKSLIGSILFSSSGPTIHHLLFADYTLFMCKVDEEQCHQNKQILKCYEQRTRQTINVEKSSITFEALVLDDQRQKVKQILGVENEGRVGKYLGLPECFSGSKIKMLSYIHKSMKNILS